ncbi:MAG: hypothetical protein ACT4QG_22365 [Sporichthyaceae bacterium]
MSRISNVVYGYVEDHDSFAIYELGEALELSAEWRAIYACSTVAEFLALQPTLRRNFFEYNEADFEDMTDPFDPRQLPGVGDGDWPPMATANALELFDVKGPIVADLRAEAGATIEDTTLNGWYLHIAKDRESDLLAVLTRHGIAATRDDEFVALTLVPYR